MNQSHNTQNEFLRKIKISDSDSCRLCGQHCETVTHILVYCSKVAKLWIEVQSCIEKTTGTVLNFNYTDKIWGCTSIEHSFWPGNFLLLVTRYFIIICVKDGKELYLSQLQNFAKTKYNEQKLLFQVNNNLETFERRWSLWRNMFNGL